MSKKKDGAPHRMVISDESENGRGFRVLTSGISLERYDLNPVLLWMHRRGEVIGQMRNVRVEDGRLTGEPWFDMATDLSRQISEQYALGSVRACSMGIDVLQVEAEPTFDGNERPVVTRSSLYEVSLVDVPENANTVSLSYGGHEIGHDGLVRLSHGAALPGFLMTETKNPNIHPNQDEMKLSEMAVLLGLDAGASEEQVRARVADLLSKQEKLTAVTAELETARQKQAAAELAHVESLVDSAISDMRLTADKRQCYVDLGKQVGPAQLGQLLADMRPVGRISETLEHQADSGQWKRLSDVPAGEIAALKARDRGLYARLYKAEYGMDLPAGDD